MPVDIDVFMPFDVENRGYVLKKAATPCIKLCYPNLLIEISLESAKQLNNLLNMLFEEDE